MAVCEALGVPALKQRKKLALNGSKRQTGVYCGPQPKWKS